MGRYVKTIYGRQYISDKEEVRTNALIVIIGLLFIIGVFVYEKAQTVETTASVEQSEIRKCIEVCGYEFK